ncbi:MAG: hypothetical protein H6742_15475 [Alphaproteobacteria bacterium]|nr:hypothetical protein [Alphaproteobacteria bacterium]
MLLPAAALALLAATAPAHAAEDDWKFELEGYYRTRAYIFAGGLFGNKDVKFYDGQEHDARMLVQRLRLQPGVNFQDRAKFFMMADVLDDVVWGDNQSAASTALFAGDPTSTGYGGTTDGQARDTFRLKRAWMEFKVPVGLVRVGRQPSSWGMGLLANSGDGFDDVVGENHGGSTYDRAIFATKPIAIAQTIAGKEPADIPLFFAIGVDRLVEDPLIQYYGFKCQTANSDGSTIKEGDDNYDARCDPDGEGFHTVEHDFDEDRTDDQRTRTWWIDQDDDVMEMVYALIYRGEGLDIGGSKADLTVGGYMVNRIQDETASKVLIADAYVRFLWKGIYLEGEGLTIQGKTAAIALPGAVDATQTGQTDPDTGLDKALTKNANIWGYVVKGGYQQELYSVIFEHGFASGDDNPADAEFTGRPLHADYNVGLLLYEEVLAHVTAATWSDAASGLWSNGGVYNSRYIYPQATWKPMDGWEVTGAWLMAWPHKPDGSRILCAPDDEVACEEFGATAKSIGWEADLALKHRFHNHVLFSLESAYARTTDRLPYETVGLHFKTTDDGKRVGNFYTLQSRIAYEF